MYERPGPLLIFQNHDMTRPLRLVFLFSKDFSNAKRHTNSRSRWLGGKRQGAMGRATAARQELGSKLHGSTKRFQARRVDPLRIFEEHQHRIGA